MTRRGIYNRDGELIAYLDGTRVYNLNDEWIGEQRGRSVIDRAGERRWLMDGDAVLDLRGNVLGYVGASARDDW